jgi:hypothetical protein
MGCGLPGAIAHADQNLRRIDGCVIPTEQGK